MPAGTTTLHYSAKARSVARMSYDDRGLAKLSIAGGENPLELSMLMSADQLQELVDQGSRVLARMIDENAVGVDTMNARTAREIEHLEHILNPQKPRLRRASKFLESTPKADLDAAELRRLALLEVAKVREAKARGDYA